MKASQFILVSLMLCGGPAVSLYAQTASAEDATGLPGDNFSLQGALEMFKKAASPEEFEKLINAEDNKVNNLDLNGDGDIDYIKVIEKAEGDTHDFILQAAVAEEESQDIAVIAIEKRGDDDAILQIVGDEDIYGEETIIEPKSESLNDKTSTTTSASTNTNVVVNVYAWPAVRYIYRPSYTVWVSPWGWRARPVWWRPWRPVALHAFHPYHTPYRHRYVIVHEHRIIHARRMYTPVRTTSVIVRNRHAVAVNRYRNTRTTKSVTIDNGNGRNVKATRRTTTVEGPRGRKVKTTKTTRRRTKD